MAQGARASHDRLQPAPQHRVVKLTRGSHHAATIQCRSPHSVLGSDLVPGLACVVVYQAGAGALVAAAVALSRVLLGRTFAQSQPRACVPWEASELAVFGVVVVFLRLPAVRLGPDPQSESSPLFGR